MHMIQLSAETEQRISALFPPGAAETARKLLLDECGDNLPLITPAYAQLTERIRFAVLKLSQGDLAALQNWIDQAKIDWRDVLVSAGFASGLDDHLTWLP
jgi:hypothetical protein